MKIAVGPAPGKKASANSASTKTEPNFLGGPNYNMK